jgi:long-chain acyl-CoA synthetase
MNIAEVFTETAHRIPDKPMLIFQHEAYTFKKMDELSARLAAGLASLGVGKGDVVSIGIPNGPEVVVSFLAVARLGAVAVPLNIMLKEKELAYIFKDRPVKAAITFPAHAEIMGRLRQQGMSTPRAVVAGEGCLPDGLSYRTLLEQDASSVPLGPVETDDTFLTVYTSGTTGEPKGVMLTHGNALSVARAVAEFQHRSENDREVCFFPLTHITGIVNFIVDSLTIGAAIILQKRFDADDYLENFSRYQCTVMGAVTPVFQAVLASPRLKETDVSHLRLITSGGASLPVDLYQKLKDRFGVPILEMYGMTENAATLTSNTMETQKEGSVGIPLPGMSIRVVGENDQNLPPGEVGEVLAQGPGIMKGYYNKPELTQKALRGGWYHTGDLGRLDEDGFLYIVDRKDDMINAGAFKIYPRDVEEVLYTHPAVRDCAVIGVPDDRLGQAPIAFVVVFKDAAPTADELKAFCRDRIANYKVPRRFLFVGELPRTAQGKIMKRLLKEA